MLKIVYMALGVMMFANGVQATAKDYTRKDAKTQRQTLREAEGLNFARACNVFQQTSNVTVEIFQVLELPINVHEAALVKSDKGYSLKLSLANSSDSKMLGLRYSLIAIDSKNHAKPIANRTEGISIPAYTSTSLTFKSPMKFKLKDGERLVLMLEQVISRDSIWEVVKAKEALDSYARGDYSVTPAVLRVANQVDAPPGRPVIFRQ